MFSLKLTTMDRIDRLPLDGEIEIGVGMEPQDVFRWITGIVFHVETHGTLPELAKPHCGHENATIAAYAFDTEKFHAGLHCPDCDWEFSGSTESASLGPRL